MPDTPPIQWFRSPGLTEPTPLTIDKSGRVMGHAALWGSQHMSFPGRNITPPRSTTDYREFHVGATTVMGDDGAETEISVGTLVMGSGHAGTSLSAADTASFYDTSSTVAAVCCAGEDEVGLWVAGALMEDLDEVSIKRLKACAISGDWRAVPGAGLTLIALLAVSTPGFAIPRSRVASGAPLSLVAAGALAPPRGLASFSRRTDPAWTLAALSVTAATISAVKSGGPRMEISDQGVRFLTADGEDLLRPWPADPAGIASRDEIVAAVEQRLDARKAAGELSAAHAALVAELDDTPAVVAALLAAVDDTPQAVEALLAELDNDEDDVSDEDLQALADLAAEEGLDEAAFMSRMPAQLRASYLRGKVAARIRWGSPGSMTRCMRQAKQHGVVERMRGGMCGNLRKIAEPGR